MEHLRTITDYFLDALPAHPTGADMDKLMTVGDFRSIRDTKGLQTVLDGASDLIVSGPKELRGHHIICEYIQTRLSQLGVAVGDFNATPVKVFTQEEHYGAGANSLHNRMNAWENGVLSSEKVKNETDKTSLINNLIKFYKDNGNDDMAKAVRGWSNQHGIPYTE